MLGHIIVGIMTSVSITSATGRFWPGMGLPNQHLVLPNQHGIPVALPNQHPTINPTIRDNPIVEKSDLKSGLELIHDQYHNEIRELLADIYKEIYPAEEMVRILLICKGIC